MRPGLGPGPRWGAYSAPIQLDFRKGRMMEKREEEEKGRDRGERGGDKRGKEGRDIEKEWVVQCTVVKIP